MSTVSNHTRQTEMQSMFAELRVSSASSSANSFIVAGRGTASPLRHHCNAAVTPRVSKLHHTYHHHLSRASMGNAAAMREARGRLKHDAESNHVDSPSVWVRGELCIPAGPLPSFIDAMTIEDALHDLPEGARLACIKCVSAWRMGHLDAKSLRECLRSVAWQSAALQQCVALSPARGSRGLSGASGEERSSSEEGPCELLSEEEMRSMMCGLG